MSGSRFGGPGLRVGEELVDVINQHEIVALYHMKRGYEHMRRALEGDNASPNTLLAQRHFAIASSVGGLINARVNAARLRTEVWQGRETE